MGELSSVAKAVGEWDATAKVPDLPFRATPLHSQPSVNGRAPAAFT